MRWSVCRGLAFVLAATGLACTADSPADRGGFDGDERPTFQADNPYAEVDGVEWKEWSSDLLVSSSKPILLDLSGLWCHYCHLYDVVVYGKQTIAEFINENYTPVRVDADARPDIDARYNEGGWPSLVVLTPEGYPIAGTGYDLDVISPFLRSGVERFTSGGDSARRALATNAEDLARRQPFLQETGDLDAAVLSKVISGVARVFDEQYGGFKPPEGGYVRLVAEQTLFSLTRDVDAANVEEDLDAFLVRTLDAMANGAVRDHLFGGFHRSVEDRAWTLPHFEKLLGVQAWIADTYLAAYERWGSESHRDVAEETIAFVEEFLSNPDGITFSNSVDSDRGVSDEGSFYTWSRSQVDSLLTEEEAEAIAYYYGIAPSGEVPGRRDQNTLFPNATIERLANRLGVSQEDARGRVESARARMRASRLAGERPRIDARAFAAPNLRMATTLFRASRVLENDAYRARALTLVDFFTATHFDATEGVPHMFDGKRVGGPQLLASQVSAVEACLAAHEATGDAAYLERARQLRAQAADVYRNELTGSYWDIPSDSWDVGLLKTKIRPLHLNVRMAMALMDISERTGDSEARREAEQILKSFSASFGRHGLAAVPYAAAVHRLFWNLRPTKSS